MEILSISNPTLCLPQTLTLKFPPNHSKPTSPFLRTPFSLYLSRFAVIKFQTWAHSGRPSNRRNSLRKKLLLDLKVNPNQIPNDPFSVSGNGVEESGVGVQGVDNVVEVEKPKSKLLRESVLWNKLGNWADQYKRDVEYWGVGSGRIFTVYEDSIGGIKRVVVDEDPILKRSKVNMAREMESGNNVIARNSSVAKFMAVQGFVAKPRLLPRLSELGRKVLYVLVVVWMVKKLFVAFGEGDKEVEEEKEKLAKGTVEVVVEPWETPAVDIKKQLDKEQLRNSILKVKDSVYKSVVHDSSDKVKTRFTEMDYKGSDSVVVNKDIEMDDPVIEISSNDSEQDDGLSNHQNEVSKETTDSNTIMQSVSVDVPESIDNSVLHEEVSADKGNLYSLDAIVPGDREIKKQEIEFAENDVQLTSSMTNENSVKKKPRIIQSVKEARDYLSKKHDKQDPGTSTKSKIELVKENIADLKSSSVIDLNDQNGTLNRITDSKPLINSSDDSDRKDKDVSPRKNEYIKDSGIEPGLEELQKDETTLDHEVRGISTETRLPVKPENWPDKNLIEVEHSKSDALNGLSDSKPATNPSEDSDQKNKEFGTTKDDYLKPGIRNHQKSGTTLDSEVNGISTETRASGKTENWLEKNFHEVEPIDDHLRDIVFRVRENELSGRDPFYLMNDEDKDTFFSGLEKKVEKENKKLSDIHEWLHSNIENLDYGADGISIYDPPEKIIPRWKGPPVEKIPEFLNEFLDERMTSSTGNMNPVKKDESGFAITSAESSLQEKVDGPTVPIKKLKNPKTIIEGSDGSVKVGKKSGKEYWQHTKKWSQGFLDCYNDETDPEVKSIMKDMAKGLDRWITEKEIEEAAELMEKLPDRNRSFMEKKLNKIKREMELFGPQAVVSKYREYAVDEEEDYLWWLDLSHILEQIAEIGSKMYHDMMIKERSVDINTLMKGVFGISDRNIKR
uniref:Uncharacterized protein n=1 Tax=Glycine max TaxID=3847 RepID=A0A0R0IZH0_SOYBN